MESAGEPAITAESAIIRLTAELHELGKIILRLEARLASIEERIDRGSTPAEGEDEPISEQIAAFGRRIKAYRKRHKLTLRQLAERTGVSATTLSRVERGIANFEQRTWHKIAGVINQDHEEAKQCLDNGQRI